MPQHARGRALTTREQEGRNEVVVTARRRPEDAQRILGSLSVIGGGLLDRSYTVNTQQLAQLVPSLNYSSANPRNTANPNSQPAAACQEDF